MVSQNSLSERLQVRCQGWVRLGQGQEEEEAIRIRVWWPKPCWDLGPLDSYPLCDLG